MVNVTPFLYNLKQKQAQQRIIFFVQNQCGLGLYGAQSLLEKQKWIAFLSLTSNNVH